MRALYEWPPTRSQRVRWALEELGIEHTSRLVDLTKGEQDRDAYRAIHPLGVVPALETDDYTIFESVAIVLQLVDEHPERGLGPPVGSAERARYYQWCVFGAAELDPSLMMYFDNAMRPLEAMRPPGTPHDPSLAARGRADFATRAQIVSKLLEGRDFVLDSGFTGADVVIGHSCFMAAHMGLLAEHPVLERYFGRLQERPAHRRAYGE